MRYLALDHGTKRIGVAVSDELKMIAQPLVYIPTEPFDAFWGQRYAQVKDPDGNPVDIFAWV